MSKTNTNRYDQRYALVPAGNEQQLLKSGSLLTGGRLWSLGISHERRASQGSTVAIETGQVPKVTKKDITLKLFVLVAMTGLIWLILPATAHAASRYWVGSTLSNNWNATAPTNWSATSGGANNASVPGSSDDVFFDGVGTLALNASTISANITINSLTVSSGYTSTLTHNSSVTLTIAGNTFDLSGGSGFAYTLGSATTSALSFTSTTGTSSVPTAITSNGQTLGNVTINGSAGYFALQDAMLLGTGTTFTFTAGTFDANNKNLSTGLFSSSNSNTRTLTMGTGTWSLTGTGTVWTTATTTGLTLTATTATIKTTDSSSTNKTISAGSLAGFPSIWISAGSGATGVTFTGVAECQNLDFTGYTGTGPTFPNTINGSLTLASGMTMPSGSSTAITFAATSGTKTITSAGQTISRPLDFNGVGGTWQLADALTVGSTRLLSVTKGTFDANNKNVTIDSFDSSNSNTRTVTMGTGTWTLTGNAETIWTTGTTSGLTFNRGSAIIANYSGATGTRTISSGSLAEANAPSFSITAGTDTLEILTSFFNLDFTGFAGTLSNSTRIFYGNLTLASGMTLTAGTGGNSFRATSGTQVITSNGVTLDFPVAFNGVGGTFQLADALTVGSSRTVTLTNGTFDANNKNLSMGKFSSANSNTRTLTMGTGTWTLASTGTVWDTSTTTGLTLTTTTATIKTTNSSSTNKTISAGSLAGFPSIWISAGSGATGVTFTNVTNVQNLDFTGYTGTGPTFPATINGSLTLASGMTMPSGSSTAITFAATSGTKTITSAGKIIDRPLTFNGVGGTWQLADTLDIATTSNRALTITNGTLDGNGKAMSVGTWSNSGTFTPGAGTLTVTDTSTLSDTTAFYNLTVSGSSKTVTLGAALNVTNALTITAGTLDASSRTITLSGTTGTPFSNSGTFTPSTSTVAYTGNNGSGNTTVAGVTYYNVTVNNSSETYVLAANTTVNNNLTITAGTLDAVSGQNYTLSVGGNWSNSGTFAARSGTVTFTKASGTQTVDSGGSSLYGLTHSGAGTLQLTTNALTVTNALTNSAGTLDLNALNLTATGATYSNDGTLQLQGGETLTGFTNDTDSGTTTYVGTSTYSALTAGNNYYHLTFNGSGGSWTHTSALDVNGNLTITAGTLNSSGNSVTLAGDWSNSGGYVSGANTVTFDGSSAQTLTTGGTASTQDFNNVTVNKGSSSVLTAASYAVLINGALTITAGTFDIAGQNLTVSGAFSNTGTLQLQGGETVSLTMDTDSGTIAYNGTGSYTTALALGNTYYHLTFNGSGGVWEPSAAVTVNGNFTITTGTFDVDGQNLTLASSSTFSNTGTLRLQGAETFTNLTMDTDSGTIEYDGSSTYTGLKLGSTYNSLTISGSGTWKLTAALTANGNVTVSGGTFDFNGYDPTVAGNFVNTATVSNASARTLTLNGTTQTFTSGSLTFSTVALTGSSGTVTMGSNVTVSTLLSIAAGRTLGIASYTLTSSGSITNAGTISPSTGSLIDASSGFYIADSNFDIDDGISLGSERLYVTLTDESANLDGTAADTVTVTVSCATDSESVTLTETGNATEIFRNSSGLATAAYSGSATNNNSTLTCTNNATITASYTDAHDSTDTQTDTATATTDTLPTAPSNLAGSAASATSIAWTWTDNASNETGFKLYDSSNTLKATMSTANTTSYTETGLTEATSYTRKIVAYNTSGNSGYSSSTTVTTPVAAPTVLAGTAVSSTAITWTWTDNSSHETGFKIYSSTGTLIATLSANTATYTETSLSRGTAYSRYVVAYDSSGDSSATSTVSVTTLTSAPTTPSLKSPADGSTVTTTLPTFIFGRSTDSDDGISTYTLIINPGKSNQKSVALSNTSSGSSAAVSQAALTANDSTITATITNSELLAAGDYTWKIRATDAAGNTSDSEIWNFTISPASSTSPAAKTTTTLQLPPALIGPPSPPPTIAEVIEKIARGETPSRTPPELQLQALAKQAVIRREKEAANLFAFLERFIPRAFLDRLDRLIAFVFDSTRQGMQTALRWTGTRLAAAFGFTSEKLAGVRTLVQTSGSQSVDVITQRRTALAALGNGLPRVGGQFIITATTIRERWLTLLERARNNRLQLAAANEQQLVRLITPGSRLAHSLTIGARVAWENLRGVQDAQLAISDVTITNIEPTQATVTWKTNRVSRGKVNYGPSISYGEEAHETDFTTDHRVSITGLKAGAQYYFEVLATDLDGQQTYDAYYGFSTLAR